MLTYSGHLDKQVYIEWIQGKTKTNMKFIRLAHETGDEEINYEHTHAVIDFGKRFVTESARFFDFENVHPNIKKILDKKHWDNAVTYLFKEDLENLDLKIEKTNLVDAVWNCDTLQGALSMAKKPSDAMGLSCIYKAKKREIKPLHLELYPWQQDCEKYCFGPVNDRKIRVYYDPKGGKGKTKFIKYMMSNYPEKCLFFTAINYRDTAFAIKAAIDNGWGGDTILINLSRDYEGRDSIYSIMESMKDGMITSNKYEAGSVLFDDCHVVLMTNFEVDKSRCSLDRWDIVELK